MTAHIAGGRALWPLDADYLGRQFLRTAVFADDSKIRWLMAIASLGWAILLWLPLGTMERSLFQLMRYCPGWLWGLLFFVHGVGAIWRLLEERRRVRWGLWINGLGFAVWSASTILQIMAIGIPTPATSLEVFGCVFLFMAWVGTGMFGKITGP